MPLLGSAAVAMWWEISAELRAEFEDWHTHEHFPERLSIPGFLRGSRWADRAGGDGFFVMYELDAYATLTSPHYLARLNDPTPWSAKMMPHHRNMVRSLCHVEESFGGGVARSMATIRLSPLPAAANDLRVRLRERLSALAHLPAITGAHLLRTDTPAHATTREQAIRGGADSFADWIVLISGYDARAVAGLAHDRLSAASLAADGAEPGSVASFYDLCYAATPADFADN
jgi:hypothetical protein